MHQIILDTDLSMGAPNADVDDGFALALALADPDIEVLAVTTVNGNTDVFNATRLSRRMLEQLGRSDIPVHRGADRPLTRPSIHPEAIAEHERRRDADPGSEVFDAHSHAALAIIDLVRAHPHELTICAIGPLTNVALALRLDPDIAPLIERIVVMGGVFLGQTGETSLPGEFNIWNDPEAANDVLSHGIPVRFVGLDVTLQVRMTLDEASAMEHSPSAFAQYAGKATKEWIEFLGSHKPDSPIDQQSCAMHDPLAVAAISHPELLQWRAANVRFAVESEYVRGIAVTDLLTNANHPAPNCEFATGIDAQGFLDLLTQAVRRF